MSDLYISQNKQVQIELSYITESSFEGTIPTEKNSSDFDLTPNRHERKITKN